MLKKPTALRWIVFLCAFVSLYFSTAAFSGTEQNTGSIIPGDDHGRHRGHQKGSFFNNPSNRYDLRNRHRHHEKRKHERHEKKHHQEHEKRRHHERH